jgi:hypothetical protein
MSKKRVNYNKILDDAEKKVKKINKIEKKVPTEGKALDIFNAIYKDYVAK